MAKMINTIKEIRYQNISHIQAESKIAIQIRYPISINKNNFILSK